MNRNIKKIILLGLLGVMYSAPLSAIQADLPLKTPLREKLQEDYTRIELKGGVKIDSAKQVITLNLRDSDLRQVIRMLANKSGKNVIIHEGIRGTISVDLVDVELNKAIEYIMTVKELTYWEDGNTIIVASNSTANTLGIKMEEVRGIKIKHIDASKVAEFLNSNIFSINRPNTSSQPIVTTNPSSNEILIFGNKEDIKMAQEVVKYLDVKPNMSTYTVMYTNAEVLASKICWTVFNTDGSSQSFTRDADLSEGSEIKMICGNTTESEQSVSAGSLASFKNPSYWVLADTGLNQITIYGGTQEQLGMAQEIITNFDKREPQVYLDISIIELNESGSKSLENALSLTTTNSNGTDDVIEFVKGAGENLAKTTFPVFELFGGKNNHTVMHPSLTSQITAVISESKGRLLANPRVITANNVSASIDITTAEPGPVTVIFDDSQTPVSETGSTIDLGINFEILPKITPSGYVYLSINPSYDSKKSGGTDATGTLSDSRSIQVKNVRVKDGDTLVLAGLMQETETITRSKVPVLGDIPILGVLFQNQQTEKNRSELIIMVTPRIIYDPDQVVESI